MSEKRIKITKKVQCILAVILVLLLGFLVELGFNLNVILLPAEQKGISMLDLDSEQIFYEGDWTRDGDRLVFCGQDGWITIRPDCYVDKFGYEFDVYGTLNLDLQVTGTNVYGDFVTETIQDWNSAMIDTSVVSLRREVKEIVIHVTQDSVVKMAKDEPEIGSLINDDSLAFSGFFVKNEASFQWMRALFVWVIAGVAAFFVLCADLVGRRVEVGFLVMALSIGSLMVVLLPATKVGWDEEMHFLRAYQTSYLPSSAKSDIIIEMYMCTGRMTWPYNVPTTLEEREQMNEFLNTYSDLKNPTNDRGLSAGGQYTPSYLASALLLKIGRMMGQPFSVVYQMGRWGNLLLYSIMMFLAIRIIPIGKRILSMIALMPTPLFLACTYSYDAMVFSFMCLGVAILVKEILTPEEKVSWTTFFVTGFIFLFGGISKAVYAPLILIALALPDSKFKDKKQAWIMRCGVVLAFLALCATFVLPSLMSGQEMSDSRGGNTSSVSQMSYVLGKPFAYAQVLIANIWASAPDYLSGRSVFGLMGHLDGVSFANWFYLFAIGVIMTDTYRDERICKSESNVVLTWGKKFWIFLMCGACAALVWTGLYMAFTEVGKTAIAGVQGRYYLPILLPLALVLNQSKIKNEFTEKNYTRFVFLVQDLILFGALLELIVLPLCF